jgi:hypothetical protein
MKKLNIKPLTFLLPLTFLFFFSSSTFVFAGDFQDDGWDIFIIVSIIVIIAIFNMEAEHIPTGISIVLATIIIYFTAEHWLSVLASLLGVCAECVEQDYEFLLFPVIFLSVLILPIIYWVKKKLKL